MNELTVVENKKAKERSPSFPFISLEYAIERVRQFFVEEKRGSTLLAIAARHWRYSPSSSGALQTVSALKSYGLLADEGGGEGRKVRLTDTALRIILDDRPQSPERDQFIRQAALTPTIAAEIYKNWPEGLPSSATLNHWLVLERKFAQEAALKAVKIIQQNQSFAKIYEVFYASSDGQIESDNEFKQEYAVQISSENIGGEQPTSTPPRIRFAGGSSVANFADAPSGKQVGSAIPVTRNCSMSIIANGPVTGEGLDRLIAYINLIRSSFPEKDEEPVP